MRRGPVIPGTGWVLLAALAVPLVVEVAKAVQKGVRKFSDKHEVEDNKPKERAKSEDPRGSNRSDAAVAEEKAKMEPASANVASPPQPKPKPQQPKVTATPGQGQKSKNQAKNKNRFKPKGQPSQPKKNKGPKPSRPRPKDDFETA